MDNRNLIRFAIFGAISFIITLYALNWLAHDRDASFGIQLAIAAAQGVILGLFGNVCVILDRKYVRPHAKSVGTLQSQV